MPSKHIPLSNRRGQSKIKIRNLRQQVGEEILTALSGASVPDNGPVSTWGRQLDRLSRMHELLNDALPGV